MGCTVECDGTAPVSGTQYSDIHTVILLISLSDRKLLLIYHFADLYASQATRTWPDIRLDFLLKKLQFYIPVRDSHMSAGILLFQLPVIYRSTVLNHLS